MRRLSIVILDRLLGVKISKIEKKIKSPFTLYTKPNNKTFLTRIRLVFNYFTFDKITLQYVSNKKHLILLSNSA